MSISPLKKNNSTFSLLKGAFNYLTGQTWQGDLAQYINEDDVKSVRTRVEERRKANKNISNDVLGINVSVYFFVVQYIFF